MTFAYKHRNRNPRPALGPGILTLSQLRHYVRLFWSDRRYGICHIRGGKKAFLRYCGDAPMRRQIMDKIIRDPPVSEWLPSAIQRIMSRKVLQVLRGEVIFIEDSTLGVTWRPMLGAPEPPVVEEVLAPDHQFRIERTVLGPRIRRF